MVPVYWFVDHIETPEEAKNVHCIYTSKTRIDVRKMFTNKVSIKNVGATLGKDMHQKPYRLIKSYEEKIWKNKAFEYNPQPTWRDG